MSDTMHTSEVGEVANRPGAGGWVDELERDDSIPTGTRRWLLERAVLRALSGALRPLCSRTHHWCRGV
ncbi:MAG: hypothetical protein C5B48_12050 [Candidatus Rokuibacteriota bacterium]|nr:MAG: hypothetical protein C5B48_12050 [Candidatus Rokubacteria bacterium]